MTKYEFVQSNCEIENLMHGVWRVSTAPLVGPINSVSYGGCESEEDCVNVMIDYFDRIYENSPVIPGEETIKRILERDGWNEMDYGGEIYTLTPKGLFCLCLLDNGLVTGIDDPRIDHAYQNFENMMKEHGYIVEDNECDDH